MALLLFFLGGITFFFGIIYFIAYLQADNSKKAIALARQNDHKLFEGIEVSAVSYSKMRSMLSLEVTANLFVGSTRMLIASPRINLFNNLLPLNIDNRYVVVTKLKTTTFNTIYVVVEHTTLSLGRTTTTELTIQGKSKEQLLEIYAEMKSWNEATTAAPELTE